MANVRYVNLGLTSVLAPVSSAIAVAKHVSPVISASPVNQVWVRIMGCVLLAQKVNS